MIKNKYIKIAFIFNISLFSIIAHYNLICIIFWIIFYNPYFLFLHISSLIVFLFNISLFLHRLIECYTIESE